MLLAGAELGDEQVAPALEALHALVRRSPDECKVCRIDLSTNNLTPVSAELLSDSIASMSTLTHLSLRRNAHFGEAGVARVCTALTSSTSRLHELDLDGLNVSGLTGQTGDSESGAAAVLSYAASDRAAALRVLVLASNDLDDAFVVQLLELLSSSLGALTELHLDCNMKVTDASMAELCERLPKLRLTHVGLSETSCSPELVAHVESLCAANKKQPQADEAPNVTDST